MESGLQNGTFVYKMGFLVTKGESCLQNGNLELQMGISDCNSSRRTKQGRKIICNVLVMLLQCFSNVVTMLNNV
jgi:hypothetical protein